MPCGRPSRVGAHGEEETQDGSRSGPSQITSLVSSAKAITRSITSFQLRQLEEMLMGKDHIVASDSDKRPFTL